MVEPPPTPSEIGEHSFFRIVAWLSGDECHELDDAGMAAALGQRLRAAGLPLDRLTLFLRKLHPEIFARTVAWAPNEPVEILDRKHGLEHSVAFLGSPLRQVVETRRKLVVRVPGRAQGRSPNWMQIDVFRDRNLAEFVIAPLCGNDGPVSVAVFATAGVSGFRAADHTLLEHILPALRTACEVRSLRQAELTLLDTYVGAATAQRILAGGTRRGQIESLEAALLLCDLRDFTGLSNRLPGDRVLELLNGYFDRVIPSIIDAGGEVLKFMGDAVLAYFSCGTPRVSSIAALSAARCMLEKLANPAVAETELHAGVALHYGNVSYGNIGSGTRLDFTVIGPDVNLVSRIQTVCGATGCSLLMSARFAALIDKAGYQSVGTHRLKGFEEPAELFTLGAEDLQ
ncbi:MAG TPA: adenylate/guanylate cyclase domain-containing protein [Stellaceae bacterium]|jgi:adenylate cyclase|nr:adenylate/guanylate cyclase domain-containing protein [Stellaceae bacterium]